MDFKVLLSKVKANWYYFAVAIFISLSLAFIKIKVSNQIFQARATLLIGDISSGSRAPSELLDALEIKDKNIQIEDIIGLLTSYSMVSSAIEKLDFEVSYFELENHWPNRFGNFFVNERIESFPFKVEIDAKSDQLVGIPIFIEKVSDQKFRIKSKKDEGLIFNFETLKSTEKVYDIDIDEEHTFGKPINNEYFNITITLRDEYLHDGKRYYFVLNNLNRLAKNYQSKLLVQPISRNSRILEMVSEGGVLQKEIYFLNKLLEVFIEYDLNRKNQLGLKTINFIDNQLLNISDSLRKAELALESYRSINKIMDINYVSSSVMDKLDQLESEKSNLIVRLNAYRDLSSYLDSHQNFSQAISPTVLGIAENSLLGNLLIQYSDLNRQRAGLEVSAKEGNPILTVLDKRIKNTKQSLIENLNTVIKNTQNSLDYTNQRIATLESNIIKLPQNERKLQQLERKFNFNDQIYDFLLEKRTAAAIEYATNTPDVEIVDTAKMVGNGPVAPKKKFIYLLALTVGMMLPAVVLAGQEIISEKIKNVGDIKKLTSIPVLGEIGYGGKYQNLITNSNSLLVEAFRSVRVNLQFFTANSKNNSKTKVIGISSSVEKEGKSFCSVNLGIVMAHSNKKTLLIEADMRRPKIGSYLGFKSVEGLSSYLVSHATLDQIIHKTQVDNFDVLLAGPIPPNPLDLISSSTKIKEMFEALKNEYDYIIIDTPPIGYVSEFILLSQFTDTNIYIVRYNYTIKKHLEKINDLFNTNKIKNLSILFNGVKNSGFHYGHRSKAHGYEVVKNKNHKLKSTPSLKQLEKKEVNYPH